MEIEITMVTKAPKNEMVWVVYMQDEVITHMITSNALRTEYYLYIVQNGKLKKTRYKSDDPTKLEERIK